MINQDAEKYIISYLLQYGSKAYSLIDVKIGNEDFQNKFHRSLFSCIKSLLEKEDLNSISIALLSSHVKQLGLEDTLLQSKSLQYIDELYESVLDIDEIFVYIKSLKFWSLTRQLKDRLHKGITYLNELDGTETLSAIIDTVDKTVCDFIPDILDEDKIVDMGEYSEQYLDYLTDNEIRFIGVPSGFRRYDEAIGGGFRAGTVNLIGGRAKAGKTTYCLNIANNVCKQNIPVLYLDTEMKKEDIVVKWTAIESKIPVRYIEQGGFKDKIDIYNKIVEAKEKHKKLPFTYVNISGQLFENYTPIIRRWLIKNVGRDNNGNTKPCLIVLDYLKTMDLKELGKHQEYQYLGDLITKLHNFALKHQVPIVSAVQLNRDGITREDSGIYAGSDRLVWLCSSAAIIKQKTQEDYASGDSKTNGDRKIIVTDTRYGSGMDISTQYINIISNLDCSEMIEGRYNYENRELSLGDIDNDVSNDDINF